MRWNLAVLLEYAQFFHGFISKLHQWLHGLVWTRGSEISVSLQSAAEVASANINKEGAKVVSEISWGCNG